MKYLCTTTSFGNSCRPYYGREAHLHPSACPCVFTIKFILPLIHTFFQFVQPCLHLPPSIVTTCILPLSASFFTPRDFFFVWHNRLYASSFLMLNGGEYHIRQGSRVKVFDKILAFPGESDSDVWMAAADVNDIRVRFCPTVHPFRAPPFYNIHKIRRSSWAKDNFLLNKQRCNENHLLAS